MFTRDTIGRRWSARLATAGLVGILATAACEDKPASPPPTASGSVTTPPPEVPGPPLPEPDTGPGGDVGETSDALDFAKIRRQFESIPERFSNLSAERLDAVSARVESCRRDLEAFLARNTGGPSACEASYMLGKVLQILRQRHRAAITSDETRSEAETRESLAAYQARIIALAEHYLTCAEPDAPLVPAAYKLVGDARYHNARTAGPGEYRRAIEAYGVVLRDHRDYADLDKIALSSARAHLELGEQAEGIEIIRRVLEEKPESEYVPFHHELLYKLLLAAGDLDAMLALTRKIQATYPARIEASTDSRRERDAFIRYLGYSGFREGYTLWAQGRADAARNAFNEGLLLLERLSGILSREGRQPFPELGIYARRVRATLTVLDDLAGRPPARDLDSVMWATDTPFTLSGHRGKVTAVLFRGYDNRRSQPFLEAFDDRAGAVSRDLAFAAVHYMQGSSTPAREQLQAVLAEAGSLGIGNTALGIDPDPRSGVFRSFGALVGTTTFVVFDREGNLAWWMQDPRQIDVRLTETIVSRLSAP